MIKGTNQIKILFLWVDSDGPPYWTDWTSNFVEKKELFESMKNSSYGEPKCQTSLQLEEIGVWGLSSFLCMKNEEIKNPRKW